jgi:hypothetical protein
MKKYVVAIVLTLVVSKVEASTITYYLLNAPVNSLSDYGHGSGQITGWITTDGALG